MKKKAKKKPRYSVRRESYDGDVTWVVGRGERIYGFWYRTWVAYFPTRKAALSYKAMLDSGKAKE
jgi:hypothetical protein